MSLPAPLPDVFAPAEEFLIVAGHPAAGVRTIARTLAYVAAARGEDAQLVLHGEGEASRTPSRGIIAVIPTADAVQARVADARRAGRPVTLVAVANGDADALALTYATIKVAAQESGDLRIVVAPNRMPLDRARRSAHAVAFACSQWLDRDAEVAAPFPNEPMLGPCDAAGIPLSDVIDGTPLERAAESLWTMLTSNGRLAAATS